MEFFGVPLDDIDGWPLPYEIVWSCRAYLDTETYHNMPVVMYMERWGESGGKASYFKCLARLDLRSQRDCLSKEILRILREKDYSTEVETLERGKVLL